MAIVSQFGVISEDTHLTVIYSICRKDDVVVLCVGKNLPALVSLD